MRAIGLMSGTSLDGVDAALIETDGETIRDFGPSLYRPYTESERVVLRAALAAGGAVTERSDRSGVLAEAEALINATHAETVENLLKVAGVRAVTVDVIGFHGQTIIHKPAERLTVQLGDGAALAERLGIPVVHDLRAADIAAGGQGAPVVPVYHRALAEAGRLPVPCAILNIGGVANVTWIGPEGALLAFDTGPGNALLDDLMRARTGAEFDKDGEIAKRGTTDNAALEALLTSSFFSAKPPKSLDRNHFHDLSSWHGCSSFHGRCGIDARRFHGRDRGAFGPAYDGSTPKMGRCRRRSPQSCDPRRAQGPHRRSGEDGRGHGVVDRRAGGTGLCLPRRQKPARTAEHLSVDDGSKGADVRRCAGRAETDTGKPRRGGLICP